MVTLIFRAKMREGKEKEAETQLRAMCEAVEENEPDTLAYVFHRLVDDPSQAVLYESYPSPDALQAHTKTPHMAKLQGVFGDLFDMSQVSAERLEHIDGFARGAGGPGVVAIFRAKLQSGKEDDGVGDMKKMVAAVRASEPGALTYIFHHPVGDPSELVFYEAYADDDAFKAHMATSHMGDMRTNFPVNFDAPSAKLERLERIAGFTRTT